jgi:CheY-like chemotaxis protein
MTHASGIPPIEALSRPRWWNSLTVGGNKFAFLMTVGAKPVFAPLSSLHAGTPYALRRTIRAMTVSQSTIAPGTALIVDDDESCLSLIASWVESAGYTVTKCTSFSEAKAFLAAHTPEVLITDVRLGAFNGMQLVVLGRLQHPDMTAIVCTGFDDLVLRTDAAKHGAEYLLKPLLAEDLLALLPHR